MALAAASTEPSTMRALSPEDESMSDSELDSNASSPRSTPSGHHQVGQFSAINSHTEERYSGHGTAVTKGTKRQRSDPDTIVVDTTNDYEGHAPSRYDYSPRAKRPEPPQHVADHALRALDNAGPNGHAYQQSAEASDVRWNGHYANGESEHSAEDRTASGYQERSPPTQKPWTESDENGHPLSNDGYSLDASGVAQSGSKRKRNFSNRTKTGCLTCRKRKKKCDETRPECNNCSRGGFQCAGYSTTRGQPMWNKPSPLTKGPVPLQAKDVQVRPPTRVVRAVEPAPHTAQPPAPHEGGQHLPIAIDDGDAVKYSTSPGSGESRNQQTYPPSQWPPQQSQPSGQPQPGPTMAHAEQQQRVSIGQPRHDQPPPLPPQPDASNRSEASRPMIPPQPVQHQYPPAQPYPAHPSYPPQPVHWPPQQPQYYPPYVPSNRQDSYSSSSHGRMSSSVDHYKAGSKTFTNEEIERSRMMRGVGYNHLDPTLANERFRCERALVRYNNACEWDSSLSDSEIHSMLEKIVDPSRDEKHHFLAPCKERGFVRSGARIQRPFRCTYGYNLKILEDVYIGEHVIIDDAAQVEIGPRSWIGPGVTILTTEVSKDMVDRKGTGSKWEAKRVTIAAEVMIGAYAKIYPGVTLEKGVTIEPFAVVRRPVHQNLLVTAAQGPIYTL